MSRTAPDRTAPTSAAVVAATDAGSHPVAVSRWRRIAVIAIVVSFSITAVVGILALLLGTFGDVQWRILGTTSLVGLFSVLALCHLAVVGGVYRWVAAFGLVMSALALACTLIAVWAPLWNAPTLLWQSIGVTSVLAVSAAHANLLLLLGRRRRPIVRVGLWITIGLIALLAALLVFLILSYWSGTSEGFSRFLGTVAILDVLGTVVVPVIAIFLRDDDAPASVPDAAGEVVSPSVALSPETAERLDALRAGRGVSRERLIDELVAAADEARRSIGNASTP